MANKTNDGKSRSRLTACWPDSWFLSSPSARHNVKLVNQQFISTNDLFWSLCGFISFPFSAHCSRTFRTMLTKQTTETHRKSWIICVTLSEHAIKPRYVNWIGENVANICVKNWNRYAIEPFQSQPNAADWLDFVSFTHINTNIKPNACFHTHTTRSFDECSVYNAEHYWNEQM